VIWLRGGYENEVAIIDSLKQQTQALERNLLVLEQQREDLKVSYENAVESVCFFQIPFASDIFHMVK